ncbi:endo alpha-1,4 polygalactosaminidase [Rhodococcoides kyotonense]|uniref:Glycoside-hydrolase family GH114 n=1 Tax=Rhodococcoides kyotonense TaxID=398843 RepID=A0A239M0A3_9NOCA|nr:endo alpha-1,4 polygalactosaminidase [Rhodococcus kyotonensis]SNT35339.1 Glycoside-hydrolase family GH114 [Rhodococcus kyotonensis]
MTSPTLWPPRTYSRRSTLALAVIALSAACSSSPDEYRTPPSAGTFDYQLGGAYDTDSGFDIVARDSTSEPLAGAYSICYVNGFQTQPGVAWPEDLLLRDSGGEVVVDPAWPDENILDTRSSDNRERILDIVGGSIDRCAAAGFDAVEMDNLDVWTRFPEVNENATLELATGYATRAHDAGLAIAQKNAPDVARLASETVGFDFAVAEECVAFDECDSYTEAYGSHVFDIEYTGPFEVLCDDPDRPEVTILRDRDLTDPSNPDHVYQQC